MFSYNLLLLPGDGVGPEVMDQAVRIASAAAGKFDVSLSTETRLIGGCAIDAYGTALREEDIVTARASDAVLLGAVGGPKWDNPSAKVRPEQGLLRIRKALGLFANLRPVSASEALLGASPIKEDRIRGTDLLVVRELTGGIYFGKRKQWRERRGRVAMDTLVYREHEIRRIIELAFELARSRSGRVTSVDKANVLESSRLWRSIATEIGESNTDIELEHALVDAMTMKLIQQPSFYDVIVTENMFGDILTDEASVLGGSIGLLPSASIGAPGTNGSRIGLYEPIHGSAPDIAGKDIANPAGMILSAAMMFRMSLDQPKVAEAIEAAVNAVIEDSILTGDLGGYATTSEFGDAVVAKLS
jgi:3-isopropylmalate dehydrogenase